MRRYGKTSAGLRSAFEMKVTKMHGARNDFVIVDRRSDARVGECGHIGRASQMPELDARTAVAETAATVKVVTAKTLLCVDVR